MTPTPEQTPAHPILYSFRRCPYAIRARMALREAERQVVLREVSLRDKPAALIELSPKGTVPVLQLPTGTVLAESLLIMAWAFDRPEIEALMRPPVGAEDFACRAVRLNDGHFKALLDAYKYPQRHPQRAATSWRDEAVECQLQPLDEWLSCHPALNGARPGWADLAVTPFVRQFAQVDIEWFGQAPLPSLKRWLDERLASRSFVEAMTPRLPPWRPGDAVTWF